MKRKSDCFDRNVCSKSEMYTTACKVDFMTKLYIGRALVLAIVSNKHAFKITTMKWKLDSFTWIILLFINLMFCTCNIHLYLLNFLSLYKTDAGVTYVRWGKKTCPEAANLVYSGIK
jgi:hypothetical protein